MDSELQILVLDQKPCFVHYLQYFNKFIVGTYELFPSVDAARSKLGSTIDESHLRDTLESINFRAGKLILIDAEVNVKPRVLLDFDCHVGGGVFDAKVTYRQSVSQYFVFVAHSNGRLCIYTLTSQDGYKISLLERIKIPESNMLTSIDVFLCDKESTTRTPQEKLAVCKQSIQQELELPSLLPQEKIVVGDAEGCITIVHHSQELREKVTDGDSIWQVKCLTVDSGRQIVIVGAENCSWFVYERKKENEKLVLLYKNSYRDFNAGVTSVTVAKSAIPTAPLSILLGSYDETLKIYELNFGDTQDSKLNVNHIKTFSIENGGIWRVKELNTTGASKFCIAAMYAGSYILSLDNFKIEPTELSKHKSLIRLVDIDQPMLNLAQKSLHYDIDVSCDQIFCIADFNNSLCLFKATKSKFDDGMFT